MIQVTKDELNLLLMHSSDVEEIEKNSPLKISCFPCAIFLDTATLKVVICSEIYRRGTAPRYNSKENIIFFADKVHLQQSLRKWGLAENILDEFIIELAICEAVEEQTKKEIAILPQHIINSKILMVMFIALLAQRRPRQSKFPLINPVRTPVQAGYFFVKISSKGALLGPNISNN